MSLNLGSLPHVTLRQPPPPPLTCDVIYGCPLTRQCKICKRVWHVLKSLTNRIMTPYVKFHAIHSNLKLPQWAKCHASKIYFPAPVIQYNPYNTEQYYTTLSHL